MRGGLMLAVTTTAVLAVADPATLKHPPSILPSCLTTTNDYGASAWTTDNSALYLSSAQTISRYEPSSNQLKILYTLEGDPIRCLVAKDTSSVIFCVGENVHMLECSGSTAKVVRSFGSHKRDVLSLSLSNDSTLLACGLLDEVYVHNFTTGSHTILRGLPSKTSVTACVFHPHIRTRLLVSSGDEVLIYDTTRPSAPLKTISMNEVGNCISAIACSPFSKTLIAVAMKDGFVGLVDLDKEKGLFRTLSLKVPLTTIAFSPEGALIYLGTEDGRLLIQDLRALDKPAKSIVISESGNSITTLAIQKKLKSPPDDTKAKATPKLSAGNLSSTSISKPAPSPIRPRLAHPGVTATPVRKAPPKTGTPRQSSLSKTTDPRKVLSPARDPHGNSNNLDTKAIATSGIAKAKKPDSLSSASPNPKPRSSSARADLALESMRRTSTSTSNRTRKSSTTTRLAEPSAAVQVSATTPEALSSVSNARARARSRATSSVSLAPSGSPPTVSSRSMRTASSGSNSSAISRRKHTLPTSPVPPVPPIPVGIKPNLRPVSPISKPRETSRTPSPDLPDMKTYPVTPIPSQKKKKGMAVLGLGTPEVKAWIKAGKGATGRGGEISKNDDVKGQGRTKSVGFRKENDHLEEGRGDGEIGGSKSDDDEEREREKSLSMQISPRRHLPTSSSSQTQGHGSSLSWDASPRRPRHPAHMPGTPSAGSAHELLRTIVKDVMYDFQRETQAEMMGLHLDLVRMGRGWKQELRKLMEEYVGDLNDLREENRRLREENERLRRGY